MWKIVIAQMVALDGYCPVSGIHCVVSHYLNSVVREIRTLRSVGIGGG